MWYFVYFNVGGGFAGMKVYKYFASCGYVFIYVLCPALRLVSDGTVDGAYVVNDSLVGEQITLVMGMCRGLGTLVRSYHHRLAGVVRRHRDNRGVSMGGVQIKDR